MNKADKRAEPWSIVSHGSDYAGLAEQILKTLRSYVGQVGAFKGRTTEFG